MHTKKRNTCRYRKTVTLSYLFTFSCHIIDDKNPGLTIDLLAVNQTLNS